MQDVAIAGCGSCSLVSNNSYLKGIVINALTRAKDPSYSNFKVSYSETTLLQANNMKFDFNAQEYGYELFANEMFL